MYNKKKNTWAPNVVYRKMWHWAKNTGFDCEAARDKAAEYINQITDSKSKADSEITVEYLAYIFNIINLDSLCLETDT